MSFTLTVTPLASPLTSVRPETFSVSLVSGSVAPARRSTLKLASSSVAIAVIAEPTDGASLTPLIVTVTVADEVPPFPSLTVYEKVSVADSPTARDSNSPFGS